MKFIVIGDYGKDSSQEATVAARIKTENPAFILTTGDNNYSDGEASTIVKNVKKYYEPWIYNPGAPTGQVCEGEAAIAQENRFFPSPGNHDWHAPDLKPYLAFFTQLPKNSFGHSRYYDFVKGNVHFFSVDSDPDEPDGNTKTSKQALWLKDRMLASTAKWKIVYFHHSPYSSSSKHGSESDTQWPFEEWGANMVITGHDHIYERIQKGNVTYIVNGLGGAGTYGFGSAISGSKVRYNAMHGYQVLEATETSLSTKFINMNGSLIDTYTIGTEVINKSPKANAGEDKIINLPDNSVTLIGTASDEDGTIASILWTKVNGGTANIANPNGLNPTISNLQEGNYTFRLTVTDNQGASAFDDVLIIVNPVLQNYPPIANAGIDQTLIIPVESIVLNGSEPIDDNHIVEYFWQKVSGPSGGDIDDATSITPTISNLVEGKYVFQLTVTDDEGLTNSDSVTITLKKEITTNSLIVNAGGDVNMMLYGMVQLDGKVSSENAVLNWTKIQGGDCILTNETTLKPLISQLSPGTYVFRLTATNSEGEVFDDVSIDVRVSGGASINKSKVLGLKLVDAKTGVEGDIADINNGDSISISQYNTTKYNIRAVCENTTSVKFELSGPQSYIFEDKKEPFALMGDDAQGNYYYGIWNPPARGTYTLKVIPSNSGGTGESSTFVFTFIS